MSEWMGFSRLPKAEQERITLDKVGCEATIKRRQLRTVDDELDDIRERNQARARVTEAARRFEKGE